MHQVGNFPSVKVSLPLTVAVASIRHQVLQLAVVFVCGIGQLSPGAYLLRRDLFPAIATVSAYRITRLKKLNIPVDNKIPRNRTIRLRSFSITCSTG